MNYTTVSIRILYPENIKDGFSNKHKYDENIKMVNKCFID